LASLLQAKPQTREEQWELIVVDDGSADQTFAQASGLADIVVRHPRNLGKGAALFSGYKTARSDVIVFLDADLGVSAAHARELYMPVLRDEADMTVACLEQPARKGGFGLVKGLAGYGIYRLSGYQTAAPLSGQRAVKREVLQKIGSFPRGFGIEVGLTIDTVRNGYRVLEVHVPFRHRETGRDLPGFCHRGKQLVAVGKTLFSKWWA
jgi:glycosyltransferase involved in cell wall biosynthesis